MQPFIVLTFGLIERKKTQMLPLLFWFRLFSWQPEVLPNGVALNHSRLAFDRASQLFPSIKKRQHQSLAEKRNAPSLRLEQWVKFFFSILKWKTKETNEILRLPWPPETDWCSFPWCGRPGHLASLRSRSTASLHSGTQWKQCHSNFSEAF